MTGTFLAFGFVVVGFLFGGLPSPLGAAAFVVVVVLVAFWLALILEATALLARVAVLLALAQILGFVLLLVRVAHGG